VREVQTAGHKHRSQQDGRDNDFLFHDRSRSQMKKCYGIVLGVAGVGIVGAGEVDWAAPTMGDVLGGGTDVAALTPKLLIS
jgi:hypothetical protein